MISEKKILNEVNKLKSIKGYFNTYKSIQALTCPDEIKLKCQCENGNYDETCEEC